jgi:hypothetical protein
LGTRRKTEIQTDRLMADPQRLADLRHRPAIAPARGAKTVTIDELSVTAGVSERGPA